MIRGAGRLYTPPQCHATDLADLAADLMRLVDGGQRVVIQHGTVLVAAVECRDEAQALALYEHLKDARPDPDDEQGYGHGV